MNYSDFKVLASCEYNRETQLNLESFYFLQIFIKVSLIRLRRSSLKDRRKRKNNLWTADVADVKYNLFKPL